MKFPYSTTELFQNLTKNFYFSLANKRGEKKGQPLPRLNVAKAGTDMSVDNALRMQMVIFPQSPEKMAQILLQGYHDAVAFLAKHKQIHSGVALTVRTTTSHDVIKVRIHNITYKIRRKNVAFTLSTFQHTITVPLV